MTTATIERRKEAICPPWCAGHDDRYQAWETLVDESGQIRDHGSEGITVGSANVSLNQRESDDHTMGRVLVEIYVDRDTAELDTDDAAAFAEAVMEVVRQARDWNAFQLGRDYEQANLGGRVARLEEQLVEVPRRT